MALPSLTKIALTDEVVGVTLVSSAVRTASGVSDTFAGLGNFSAVVFFVNIEDVGGTSATLNLYFQNSFPTESDFYDILAFSQITTTDGRGASYISGGNQEFAPTDGGLAAGTYISVMLAPLTRLKWVIAGTSPSFTFTVSAYCYR